MVIVIATNNNGKLEEIKKIMDEYDIHSLNDRNIDIDVIEDQNTFLGNAKKKALEIYSISNEETIADDSGLCIDALDGFPGVMTHRFLGDLATDEMRNEYLINELNKYPDRSAQVVCNLVYYDGSNVVVGEGILNGSISTEPRGTNGFGFDPIFELSNGLTLAELSVEEKNNVSARSLAATDLKKKLKLLRR
ncbi:MAG: RdgB/HAM1 family non-canonical purine NTP pyrophosphatase [Bacilli bacterium]|nr:RdgB/HAM1 family non-canonical purine NTP pyrophosphatase [Bacilli bacterium]